MKKALHITKNILLWGLLIAAIGMMVFTIFSAVTFDRANRSVFGYKFFIVQSDSMSATDFNAGDIVFVKVVDPSTLQEGDIIAFTSRSANSYGKTVTHKIRRLTANANGEAGFITYGTTTDTDDDTVVTYADVQGKYTGRLPKVGSFFAYLKTKPGYIFCILIPCLILIGYYGLKSALLFKQYKREQTEELQTEKEKLAEERSRYDEMEKELQKLRAQLKEISETSEQKKEITGL